jgi:RNA polymerase sigma-70 factor (ECF subfamily)
MDSPAFFDYDSIVFSLNPAFVISEALESGGLLDQAMAGDAEAFGGICRAYETRLLRQALTLCGNAALAEDLAQDTLVEAWKSLRRYNGRCQFFTWLCAILLNRYRNTLRQKRPVPLSSLARQEEDTVLNRLEGLADKETLPDNTVQLREEAALVMACIKELPPKHQQVIYLRFYVDHSLEGIAEALGCSVGTVKSQLFRALDKLRTMKGIKAQFANLERSSGHL